MAGQVEDTAMSEPPGDGFGRLVWSLDRLLRWPEDLMNFVAAAATFFLMLLGVVQIVLNQVGLPIFGYIDMIELAMPILAVLGIAYCQRMGTHIRMDILVGRFRGRLLWGVEAFAALATLIIAILLARFAWSFFNDAFTIGDSTTDAEIDTWPSKLLVPIAFAMLSFRMLVQFLGALRLFLSPGLVPVGVVVQKDIAEQAQDEIREAMAGGDKA
jgi:TRAP-type C4-dicarboxylate transport system permease small subunit